jgi:hypothetical protein
LGSFVGESSSQNKACALGIKGYITMPEKYSRPVKRAVDLIKEVLKVMGKIIPVIKMKERIKTF